jgi:Rrf2 family protein
MMVDLARRQSAASVSLGDISKSTKISRRYLDNLMVALKHAGLVRGRAGKGGGYQLACPPQDIRVGQVIEAAIGPINIVECVRHSETCLKSDFCECRALYSLINTRITGVLDEISLADLSDRSWVRTVLPQLNAATVKLESMPVSGPSPHPTGR